MLKPYQLFFAVLLFCSCREHKKNFNSDYQPSDKAEIISLVINSSIPTDTGFRNEVIRENKQEMDMIPDTGNSKENDSLRKLQKQLSNAEINEIDETGATVLVVDTLRQLPPNYLTELLRDTNGHPKHAYKKSELDDWCLNIPINSKLEVFDMKNLQFKYNFRYMLRSKFKRKTGHELFAGTIQISSAYFNKARNKAIVYVEKLGSEAWDYFLEKKDGKWVIASKEMIWIS